MKKKIRWGLLGAGSIVNRWICGATQVDDMEISAVSSRNLNNAKLIAKKFGIPDALSYDELLSRDDIDIVYIPVPHTSHKELAMRAMHSNKSVLVEKPAAVTSLDFIEMVECAKKNNVFLMEAMWTRCFPAMIKIQEIIENGKIGTIRIIQSAFSFRVPDSYEGRLLNLETAGGGLLDVGVYNLHFADAILRKEPLSIKGIASFGTDSLNLKIDEHEAYVAGYDKGELAVMVSGVRTAMPPNAYIYGTEGYIEIPNFYKPTAFDLVYKDRKEHFSFPVPQKKNIAADEGFQFEIEHVNDCLRNGIIESPIVTWKSTENVLRQCDILRQQWNYKFPFEK